MTSQERKAVGYIIRLASDMYAATAGDRSVWDDRKHMREQIAQFVEERMALFGVEGVLAEWITAANQPQP